LKDVRYVLTLDADTRLPPGSAQQLVGTLAHPLSRAVLDRHSHMLKAGYSIIQPRLEVDPDTTMATLFTRIFSGDTTMDLYTHASSDVYHDLFGEGIFTGKGIYDWRAVEHTLAGRIPDNTLLSHDLLEGVSCQGRAGVRHHLDGTVSLQRRGLHAPATSLDPRRLATPALAEASGEGALTVSVSAIRSSASITGRSSTTCAAACSHRPCSP
jgi:hypothetical protein